MKASIQKLQFHYNFVTFWTNMERIMEAQKRDEGERWGIFGRM